VTDLQTTVESITMAQGHRFGVGCDGHVSEIHARLTTSHNQNILSNAKLLLFFEFGRVHDSWCIAKAIDIRNVGHDV